MHFDVREYTYCGFNRDLGLKATTTNKLLIQFVSNNLDSGHGFELAYEEFIGKFCLCIFPYY